MGWFDSEDMLFTRKGLAAAISTFGRLNRTCFEENLSYVVSNKWVCVAKNNLEVNQPDNEEKQSFELHPEAVERLGLS